jgi:hypothetical protein
VAQTKADTLQQKESSPSSGIFTFGMSAGAMHFGDGGHERALSAAVSAALPHGFSIGVNPTYARAQAAPTVSSTGQLVKSAPVQGLADLPVSLGYSHALPGAWSPGFYVSLGATLPTGDTATVGGGETAFGLNGGVWMEPADGWSLGFDAGHSMSNDFASGLGSIAPTTVGVNASHDVGRLSLSLGYSTEMGAMPAGTTHSQNFAGGASMPLGERYALKVSGSVGRADGAQSWAMSIGLGTTIADVAQVAPFAAASQLVNALGTGRSLGKSRSAAAKAAAAAKKAKKGK